MRIPLLCVLLALLLAPAAADEGTFRCDIPLFTPVHSIDCVFVEETSTPSRVIAFEPPQPGCYLVASNGDPADDLMYRDPRGEMIPAGFKLYLICPLVDVIAAGGVPVGMNEFATLTLADAANVTTDARLPGSATLDEVEEKDAPLDLAVAAAGILGAAVALARRR